MPRKKFETLVGAIEDVQLPSAKPRSSRALSLLVRHDQSGHTQFEWLTVAKAIRPRVLDLSRAGGLLIGATFEFRVAEDGSIVELKRIDGRE